MAMSDDALLAVVAAGRHGTLATIKRDGRPQLSVVSYGYSPEAGLLRVSITDARAKTRNLRRDGRASMLIQAGDVHQYAVVESTVTMSEVAAAPYDPAVEELVELYRSIAGEHPDWDEFRAAMVEQGRLVLRLPIDRVYGMA
jgi:PPOX class probable F420-dependent enzyme